MPYKYHKTHQQHWTKENTSVRNWSDYNQSLKRRGDITIWLSDDVIHHWYEQNRLYDGTGSSPLYTDMALIVYHEIRQVFKLPLRQCEGFINSLFKLMKLSLQSPSYSVMSKRLKKLGLKRPSYRYAHWDCQSVKAIAIDSTGLKCFGEDEWHSEKHGFQTKKRWRKLHITVDQYQMIQTTTLTKSSTQDVSSVNELVKPITDKVNQFLGDGAYDSDTVYQRVSKQFPSADIVIPPQKDARYDKKNHFYRNRNVLEIQCYGRIGWQKLREYGRRNQSELAIQRYKRILGNRLHSKELKRQQQEIVIGCSILNKMMAMTLAKIRKAA